MENTLVFGTSVDLSGWEKGLEALSRKSAEFESEISRRSISMPSPVAGSTTGGTGSGPSDQAGELAAALAPLSSFAAKFSAQFDKVGGTIIAISRRIDDSFKFPVFERTITSLRAFVNKKFVDMEGDVTKFGRRADAVLGGISGFQKLRSAISNFGDVTKRGLGDMNIGGSIVHPIRTATVAASQAKSAIGGMFGQFALALGAVGLTYTAVNAIKDGITSAMNLGETISKVRTIFEGASGSIIANADRMAASFGLPKQAILDASAAFGLIGKAAGYNGQQTAALSNQMANLAADVSSFYNIPLDQALNKIRSGLVGEAEPMRSLGVLLSETAVKSEAMRLGLVKSGEELSEQAKVQARASLIVKGLADATGDLERTQGSSANQARKFSGTIGNLTTSIGEALLPTVNKGLALLNEFAVFLGTAFEKNRSTLESWGETIGTVFETVGNLFRNWEDSVAIVGLKIYEVFANIGIHAETLAKNIGIVASWIADNWYELILDGFTASLTILANFGKNLQALGAAVASFLMDPTQGFKVEWTSLTAGFKSSVKELPKLLKPELVNMDSEIAKHQQNIIDNEARRNKTFADSPINQAKKGVVDDNKKNDDALDKFAEKFKDSTSSNYEKYAEAMAMAKKAFDAGKLSEKDFARAKDFALKDSGLDKFRDSFIEKTQTAFDKYNKSISEAREAYGKGIISKDEFGKAEQYARKEAGLDGPRKFAGAQELGSKEAYSTVLAATTGRGEGFKNLERINTQQLVAQNTTNRELDRLNRLFEPSRKKKEALMG